MVSEDRACVVFSQWEEKIKSKSAWIAPLGICITLGATLATSSFTDHPWAKGEMIKGAFYTALVLCFGWLCRSGWKGWRNRRMASVDDFIEHLRKGTKRTDYGVSGGEAKEAKEGEAVELHPE